MEFTDYYATLGVARDADAAAVKAAYRKLARKLHPDVNDDPEAEARFKRVNEAYEVLKDPVKRAKYDRLGADWDKVVERQPFTRRRSPAGGGAGGADAGFSDFFETFFGGGGLDIDELFGSGAGAGRGTRSGFGFRRGGGAGAPPLPRRGVDIEEVCEISLEEAIRGGVRLLSVGDRQVEVRIPAGVTDGSKVRVGGEGGEGSAGGAPGDVFLRIRVHPQGRFRVRGRDIVGELGVRDDQAALGGTVDVGGPTGPLKVTIPAGSQAGRTLRLRGKGIPGLRGTEPGDLLLTLQITVPRQLGEEERGHYERLAEIRQPPSPEPPRGG